MKTQELIKALRYCSNEHKTSCEGCPMYNPNSDDMFTCSVRMEAEAADRLEELENALNGGADR